MTGWLRQKLRSGKRDGRMHVAGEGEQKDGQNHGRAERGVACKTCGGERDWRAHATLVVEGSLTCAGSGVIEAGDLRGVGSEVDGCMYSYQ